MFTISGVWLVATVLLLLSLGMLAGYAMASIRARLDIGGRTPAELKRDFDQYQSKVDRHFETTNELLERMTAQYREVYAHMAASARELCSAPDARIDDHMRLIALEQMREEAEEATVETPRHGDHAMTALASAAAPAAAAHLADAAAEDSATADDEDGADTGASLHSDAGDAEPRDVPIPTIVANETSSDDVVTDATADADEKGTVALVPSEGSESGSEETHSPITRAA